MILKYLSALWTVFAPALGNHLWQSTLFAIMAGSLTLILRKNQARARFWLWLAASVKFLIPFSSLIGIGSHLAWSRGSSGTKAGLYFAMEGVSQPFSQPTMSMIPRAAPSTAFPSLTHLLPALLAAVWLCGFLVVLSVWYVRWRRISSAIREAMPLREGREVEALRRLERIGGMRKRIEMLLSRASLEPGIFGIARPVLVWPEGISERLEDAHLEAILAHEVWHVRRRDNLAAAIHMVVEAIFWFHPLVWWLGARLVEERERACDEEVLESGSDRQVYAESILKICEFCVESPLAFVSGVTGADLKKRIARIMTKGSARKLDFNRKLLLSTAGLVAIVVPIVFGLAKPTQSRAASQTQNTAAIVPAYETVSIKPNRTGEPMAPFRITGRPVLGFSLKLGEFLATNATLHQLIRRVYDVQDDQISGGPSWLNSEHYDLEVKMDKSVIDELQKLNPNQRFLEQKRMLEAILVDRFKLALHRETKEVPVYALAIAERGLKLQRAIPGDTYPNGFKRSDGVPIGAGDWSQPGKFVGQGVPIAPLVQDLSEHYLHRTVLDKTGLTDKYDFTLQWAPAESQAAIFTALQEQLGLKLESQKAPMEVLVIDHADKPAEPQAQNTPAIARVYEVASIKANKYSNSMLGFGLLLERFTTTGATLQGLIREAYEVEDDQIAGAPNWLNSERYDIEARADKSVADELLKLSFDQRVLEYHRMLRALLADRFKLTLHREAKVLPAYALVIAENGPKLQEANPGDTYPNGMKDLDGHGHGDVMGFGRGLLTGQGVRIAFLVRELSQQHLGHLVLDKTGLTGKYDFTLQWTPVESQAAIFTAIQEQLGLKLELQTTHIEVLVIDHAEKPSEI